MAKIFFTADTHFNHKVMAEIRGFLTMAAHDEFIIDLWNETVSKRDEVYHLGDFCFGDHERVRHYRGLLNGKIHLVLGNHDHANRVENIQGLFTSVSDIKILKLQKKRIVLCHYAMRVWPASHHNSYQLYGHSHGKLGGLGKQFDVGLESNDYRILSSEEVLLRLEKLSDNLNFIH